VLFDDCCPSVLLLLVNVVVQQLDNQVDMGKDHTPTAVSLATKLVKGLPEKVKQSVSHE